MIGRASFLTRLAAMEAAVAAEIAAAPPNPFQHMTDRHAAAVKRTIEAYEAETDQVQQFVDMTNGTNPRTNLLPHANGIPENATEQQ